MILSLSEQAHLFIVSILLGVKIFMFYDFFRALRRVNKFNNAQVHIQDLIFILVITVYSFYLYLYESNGAIRGYYFLGITLGAIVYLLTFSMIIVLFFSKVIIVIEKAFIKFIKISLLPIRLIIKLSRPYLKIYKGKVTRKVKQSKKYIGKPKRYAKRKLKGFKRMIKVILEKV